MLKNFFNIFLRYAIMFVLILCFAFSFIYILFNIYSMKHKVIGIFIILICLGIIYFYKKYKNNIKYKLKNINNKKLLLYIVITAFILRFLWIIIVPTKPISDFKVMYEYAKEAAQGNYYGFHDYAYFARFTHDIITVLYFSLFYKMMDNPLFIVKFCNVICQTAAVYAMYLTVREILNEERALISAFILAFFPPFIMYTSQTMSENMAVPLYIFSVYFFIAAIKGRKNNAYFILSGAFLSFANMFRMVGAVFVIAYIMYNIIYIGLKGGIKNSILLIIGFAIPFYLVSQSLLNANITETHLWNPKEPSITSILKGTNIEHHGMYNEEDANIPIKLNHDPQKIKEVSKEIIIKRLTTTPKPKLIFHYIKKIAMQWGMGDFRAFVWTTDEVFGKNIFKNIIHEVSIFTQIIYITILIRIFSALKNNDYMEIKEMNFFYILFGGFVLLFLITEFQERYAFIISWIFVIFTTRTSNLNRRKHASIYKVLNGRNIKHGYNNNIL
ncbi:Dolichyl-phosphate-mannose-protein mannosyltransferase [Clostridium sp. USBA 49]|nr:Dolichyl-phosphate-mannose-protein mannosyltransferase [Clostridium sp. USBA 49]